MLSQLAEQPDDQEKPSARSLASESRQSANPRAIVRGEAARPAMGILLTWRVHAEERDAAPHHCFYEASKARLGGRLQASRETPSVCSLSSKSSRV